LLFRIHDLDQSFWLYSEQVRDWRLTQSPITELPLSGPRSLNSGADIGPAYYLFLWLGHALLSPLLGSFPHVGGYAIAGFQTLADFCLLLALWRAFGSWPLAVAAVMMVGTSPYEAGLTATTWNPPLAAAFCKLATAALLSRAMPSTWIATLTIVCCWIAVQMHLSALTVALPVTVFVAYQAGQLGNLRHLIICALALLMSLLFVALPYAESPIQGEGEGVAGSVSAVIADPIGRLRVVASARAVAQALDQILAWPGNRGWLPLALVVGGFVTVHRHRLTAASWATVVPIAAATAMFSLWQGRLDEYYWFLVIAPAGAITVMSTLTMFRPRRRDMAGAAVIALLLVAQPGRVDFTQSTAFRFPDYGALRRGTVALARTTRPVSAVRTAFELPAGVDPSFMLTLAGGRLTSSATETAVIQKDGRVTFEVH
jgi:hypothetical protein